MKEYTNKHNSLQEKNKNEFENAFKERNYNLMSDIYNYDMMCHDKEKMTDYTDSYFFAEILEGFVIKIPPVKAKIINSLGAFFYYTLSKDYIRYISTEHSDDSAIGKKILSYLTNEFFEVDKIEFKKDTIELPPVAAKLLNLSVGNIVEIKLDVDGFYIAKPTVCVIQNNSNEMIKLKHSAKLNFAGIKFTVPKNFYVASLIDGKTERSGLTFVTPNGDRCINIYLTDNSPESS